MTLTRPPITDRTVETLDADLRERVRREGVDPQREPGVVRRLAEHVVREHDFHTAETIEPGTIELLLAQPAVINTE